jgi:hypothetical protein
MHSPYNLNEAVKIIHESRNKANYDAEGHNTKFKPHIGMRVRVNDGGVACMVRLLAHQQEKMIVKEITYSFGQSSGMVEDQWST